MFQLVGEPWKRLRFVTTLSFTLASGGNLLQMDALITEDGPSDLFLLLNPKSDLPVFYDPEIHFNQNTDGGKF